MKDSFFRKAFSDDGKKSYYYILFTILFGIVSLCCFSWIIFSGRTFIWSGEGWSLHYKALVYYSDYLKEIFRHLFTDHALIIPEWDFYIGEGGDIMSSLLSGTAGDPAAFLSVFVPASAMPAFYAFSNVLRLYLAGLAFSALCFGTGQKNRCGIMAGAIGYSFCGWGLYYAVRVPCYLNPLILLPLIILGIVKLIRSKRPYLLIFCLCLAGMMLLPALTTASGESRLRGFGLFGLVYPAFYYDALPGTLFSNSNAGYVYGLIIGLTAPAFLAVILLFVKRKEDTFLKVLTVICLACILIPACGGISFGKDSMPGSWSFALALLCSYILVKKWNELTDLPERQWLMLTAAGIVYFVLCMCCRLSRTNSACAALPVIFMTLLIIGSSGDGKTAALKQPLLLGVTVFQVIVIAFWMYSPDADNFAGSLMESGEIETTWVNNEAAIVRSLAGEEDYVRSSGRDLAQNAGVFERISAAQYDDRTAPLALAGVQYYTVRNNDAAGMPYGYTLVDTVNGNPTQEEELQKLEKEFEGQEISDAQKDKIKGKTSTLYSVYKNDHALGIGYCYDSYFTEETLASLNAVQKQEAYLKAACVDMAPGEIEEADLKMHEYLLSYDLECAGKEISEGYNRFITTEENTEAVITLSEEIPNAEFYIELTGLTFTPTPQYDLYFGEQSVDPLNLYTRTNWDLLQVINQDKIRQDKELFNPLQNVNITIEPSAGKKKDIRFRFDEPGQDHLVNLGYTKSPAAGFKLTFPKMGVYAYESLNVYAVPMEEFDGSVEKLQENMLSDVTFGTDTLTGSLSLDEPKLLCVAVPYSKGWKAYIDGDKVQNLRVNEHYQGVVVPAGEHTIEYRYHMPFRKAWFFLMWLVLAGTIVWFICDGRKRRRQSNE